MTAPRIPMVPLSDGVVELGRRLRPGSRPATAALRSASDAEAYWMGSTILERRGSELHRWRRVAGGWGPDSSWEEPRIPGLRSARPWGGGVLAADGGCVIVLDGTGGIVRTVPLEFSEIAAVAPWRDGFLIVSTATATVAMVDDRGRPVRVWGPDDGLIEPVGIDPAPTRETFLVTDVRRHQVLEFAEDAPTRALYGRAEAAGSGDGRLDAPVSARYFAEGVLVADTKNDRLLLIAEGSAASVAAGVPLWHPRSVDRSPGGELVVTEGRGGRVLIIGPDSHRPDIVIDRSDVAERVINQPRGAHFVNGNRILLADCRNDRILEVDLDGDVIAILSADGSLDWPRHATRAGDGWIVSDGRNGRLVFLDAEGAVERELDGWTAPDGTWREFLDPHHALDVTTTGSEPAYLVTDSGAGTVTLLGADGRASACWEGLEDPHMAELVDDGVMICETGRDRIVVLDSVGRLVTAVDPATVESHTGVALRQPRGFARLPGGGILIVDTANDRLLHVGPRAIRDVTGRLSGAGSLYFPRHVAVDAECLRLVVSDFDNSRLIVAELREIVGDLDE